MTQTYFAGAALLPSGWAENVRLTVDEAGVLTAVTPNASSAGAEALVGCVVPGMANLHSHAFQRSLVGRTQRRGPDGDSFWTWREVMYQSLDRLGPEEVSAIAGWLAVELLEGGFTSVGEFHYLHHQPSGDRYDDVATLSLVTMEALRSAGLSVTMLPVLYEYSGFGGRPPLAGQRRFTNDVDGFLSIVDGLNAASRSDPGVRVGVAPHSLRAVSPESLSALSDAFGSRVPVHIHIAEQRREVADCLTWSGQRPVRWLLDNLPVGPNWCLVHATHVDESELRDVVRADAVIGLCPTTEADLGDGIFPAVSLVQQGGCFGIGTDSHVGRNATAELRLLEYGQRLRDQARARVLSSAANQTGTHLWRAAALGGARALGLAAGELSVGKAADLVCVDPDHPALIGLANEELLDGLILGQGDGAVSAVMARGTMVVRDGKHVERQGRRERFVRVMKHLM